MAHGRHDELGPPGALFQEVRFAADSPLEGDGFEPSALQQICSRVPKQPGYDALTVRNRRFESISLQQRVQCEPDFLSLACELLPTSPKSDANLDFLDQGVVATSLT